MILDEAIDRLIALREQFGGSIELMMVFNESWPMSHKVLGICTEADVIERHNSEVAGEHDPVILDEPNVVYLVQGDCHGYASKKIFDLV